MSKTTTGRHAAAKTPLLQRIRATIAARTARTEAQYAAWATTNTTLEGIS